MSYFILLEPFRRWLNRAQCALVSKNKVRKDLWTDFCDILVFDPEENLNYIQISQTNYTTISTFLQTEGRSDSLKDDSILSWITTLHDLRKLLNEEIRYTARTRVSSREDTRLIETEQKYQSRSTPPPPETRTQPITTSVSSTQTGSSTTPVIHTDTAPSNDSTAM